MSTPRPLNKIAAEIMTLWIDQYVGKPKPAFVRFAMPYVEAMLTMERCAQTYGLESGDMIVTYALTNMSPWRGPEARRIKVELKDHLEIFNACTHRA